MRRRRVIDRLRAAYPNVHWQYKDGVWKNSDGWHVYRCASVVWGDDTYETHYRRSDTGDRIYIGHFSETTHT
jgi:hypothetical protein